MLKTLDRLVLRSFIGPYIFSFFVAEFVLVMQFLWKYIDELVGKGISFWFLAELVFYYAVTIIPLAVPITILISSVMVYGDMAEKYEISSFKSAGVSLLRVMRPGIMLAIFTFCFSLVSSNLLKPKANLKFYESFENVRRQKPSLTIEEGTFNDDFKGFTIRVGEKDPDDIHISDIMIYDNTNRNYMNLTTAKEGKMYTAENGKYFIMELENGEQYRDLINTDPKKRSQETAFLRTKFESWRKIFDMSEFEFSERTSGLARRKYDLMNTFQLIKGIDTINQDLVKIDFRTKYDFSGLPIVKIDSTEYLNVIKASNREKEEENKNDDIKYIDKINKEEIDPDRTKQIEISKEDNLQKLEEKVKKMDQSNKNEVLAAKAYTIPQIFKDSIVIDSVNSLAAFIPDNTVSSMLFRANNSIQTVHERIKASISEYNMQASNKRKYILRLNQMYSWATVCIIFMFIGAPLGSIVRKGGYGYPLLIAIVFFMVFIILMILGEKLNKSESISAFLAAWLPCFTLLPVSIFLSYWALGDTGGIRFDWFKNVILKFKKDE